MNRNNVVFIFICIVIIAGVIVFVYRQGGDTVSTSDISKIITEEEKVGILESLATTTSKIQPMFSNTEKTKVLESLSQQAPTSSSSQNPLSDEEKKAILKSLEGR